MQPAITCEMGRVITRQDMHIEPCIQAAAGLLRVHDGVHGSMDVALCEQHARWLMDEVRRQRDGQE
jgi:hypothetical protein